MPAMRRRWFRFSLRSLLVLLTLVSVVFGTFYTSVRNERLVAEAVANAYGEVVYDWQVRPDDAPPNYQPTAPGPAWIREHLGPHWIDSIAEVRLNFANNQVPGNRFAAVAPRLARLHSLQSLTLNRVDFTPADRQLLSRLKHLEMLAISTQNELTCDDAAAIARLSRLHELRINNAFLSPAALGELARLAKLESLNIDCSRFDPQTGKDLVETQLDDQAAAVLGEFSQLHALMLFNTRITNEGMQKLCAIKSLETLVVGSSLITGDVLAEVATLPQLKHLGTWAWQLQPADLEALAGMPRLTSLGLVTQLTDEHVAVVARLPHIKRLTLYGDDVTDACLPHLQSLAELEWLNMKHTGVDKLGPAAAALQTAFPKCQFIFPLTAQQRKIEQNFNAWRFGGAPVVIQGQPAGE